MNTFTDSFKEFNNDLLFKLPEIEQIFHLRPGDMPMFMCGQNTYVLPKIGGSPDMFCDGVIVGVPTFDIISNEDLVSSIKMAAKPISEKGPVTLIIRHIYDENLEFGFLTSTSVLGDTFRRTGDNSGYKRNYSNS